MKRTLENYRVLASGRGYALYRNSEYKDIGGVPGFLLFKSDYYRFKGYTLIEKAGVNKYTLRRFNTLTEVEQWLNGDFYCTNVYHF